ncbi:MAG: S8 family serine peptidase [Candidatus Sericytochromatia bacterium]|nr:S8 family serine peptidase [Candidatus Tanganyikabacteria bacterium]
MSLRPVLASTVLVAIAAGCGVNPNAAPLQLAASYFGSGEFRADGVSTKEVLVKVRQGAILPFATNPDARLARIGYVAVAIPKGKTAEQVIASLKGTAGVVDAQPNRHYAFALDKPTEIKGKPLGQFLPALTIDDPRAGEMYQLTITKALEAWDTQMGSKKTRLAIVDTGVDPDHPDLKPVFDPEVGLYNVFTKDNKVRDGHGHGTHTAGIAAAAANNKEGGAGMAPGASLMAIQVLDANGGGDSRSIAAGYTWATDNGAHVISASLGIYRRDKVIEDAVQYALDKDVVCTASAGNNGAYNHHEKAPHLPSTIPGVIEVAATDDKDKTAYFSNYGPTMSVAAPGVKVLATVPTYSNGTGQKGYAQMSGTSMAAPGAAGAVALIRSQFPELKREQVKAALEKASDDKGATGYDERFGFGRINAQSAVNPK